MQKRRYASGFLAVLLVLSMYGPTAGASSASENLQFHVPHGFQELTEDELAEVSGTWSYVVAGAGVGALAGGISYLVTTPKDEWNVKDAAKHVAAGIITGAIGSLTGSWTSAPGR